MTYTAEISRNNPSCFLFIIDQSGSMEDPYESIGKPKSEAVSDAINNILQQLVIKCAKSEGVRDYFYVGVIGYGADGVMPAFGGSLADYDLVPISEIANNPVRIETRTKKVPDGAGGLVEISVKFPIWFDATANGGTPMTEAFAQANDVIADWLSANPNCFPPIVIHITDGESTDGDPRDEMHALIQQSSSDGPVILFNVHTRAHSLNPILFPNSEAQLPDEYASMLYQGASVLPDFMQRTATQDYQLNVAPGAKAFILNADFDLVITAIDIGTRPSAQLR